VLSGAWRKDRAGYIGEGAREAARRTRIEQLERELEAERAVIEGLDADLAEIAARQNRLADEHRSMPPDDGVREAHTKAAERREQLEQGRRAIADLVTGLHTNPRSRNTQVADVSWGAHEIKARTQALTSAASSEVVAMSAPGAVLLDGPALPGWCADGVCCRLAFATGRGLDPVRDRWLHDLAADGAEVRIGQVPTSALIIDSATVALPVCDTASGQTVGLATLRLPSAVTAVVELFERVWADSFPLAETYAREGAVTTRERDLLDLLVAGATDQSAAYRLGVSVRTVRRMVADLMIRLGARSRFEAGARAAERGWLRAPAESH